MPRHTPRPMTGFWNTLTDEQKALALAYDGPENIGGEKCRTSSAQVEQHQPTPTENETRE